MIYLKVIDNNVEAFGDLNALFVRTKSNQYDKKINGIEWNGYAHLFNGEIVLGKSALEEIKDEARVKIREYEKNLLDTDYKVIRASERGEEISSELKAKRDYWRGEITTLREIIK